MVEQKLERDRDYLEQLKRAAAIIHANQDFVLTTHLNPDGDGLGCQSALVLALESLGKRVTVANAHPVPDIYHFLPKQETFLAASRHLERHDVAIFLECPDQGRAGGVIAVPDGAKEILNIDHHVYNSRYGTVDLIDPAAAASGEQVWDLLDILNCQLTKRMAVGLYTAIATDTGHFKYAAVTPRTHVIVSKLLELGLEPGYMNEQLYERVPAEALKLLGMALAGVQYNAAGTVGWFSVTPDMLAASGAKQNQTENFVNYVRSVDGVQVAVFFFEHANGRVKVSLRSRGAVDVSIIAHQFGGGGHQRAAGTQIEGPLAEVQAKVLAAVEEAAAVLKG